MTDDAKQPVLQRRFRPPLRAMTQRPFDRHLQQIVGIGRMAGNRACEAPKSREQCADAVADGYHRIKIVHQLYVWQGGFLPRALQSVHGASARRD